MTQPKQPPAGVETTPLGDVVPLKVAAARLGKDPRTLIRAITAGELRGGAMPRPERLRWYVYADALPPEPGSVTAPPAVAGVVEELRAQVVSLQEANRLLIAAQQELLDADQSTHEAAEKYRAVARGYLDALAQFMTPGHLGELADL
ncbi:hypothetical protein ACQ86B_28825 (plasmid) [Mycolicibacterium aichiense]|uniref:hypothetical protein n=1 Tax=Mycolicibacterium aichiense TaxID=1799 RepID=UPI003D67B2FB